MEFCLVCDHPQTRRRLETLLPQFTITDTAPEERTYLLIRWGCQRGPDIAQYILNPKHLVEKAENAAYMNSMVRVNRLGTVRSNYYLPRYRVHLFDLRSLGITKRTSKGWKLSYMRSKFRDQLVVKARRALYSLGLHAGIVEIGLNEHRQLAVWRVSSGGSLSLRLCRRLALAITKYVEDKRFDPTGRTSVLGADPEFVLRRRSTGGLVNANRFFPYRGPVGHDRLLARSSKGRPLAEIRPAPASEPEVLTRNIIINMRKAIRRTGRRIDFVAGSLPYGFPIGGHIHISGIPLTTNLVRALDIYLSLPLLLLENSVRARRRRIRYGYLGETRYQRHGGFEYRTPPSWLISPAITLAVLSLTKIISLEYHRLPRHYFDSPELQSAFYRARKDLLYPIFYSAWSNLERVPTYKLYEQNLLPLKKLVDSKKNWPEKNVKRFWMVKKQRKKGKES
jgi:hypothetical protein